MRFSSLKLQISLVVFFIVVLVGLNTGGVSAKSFSYGGYFYDHNPVVKSAKDKKVLNLWTDKSLRKNKEFHNYFRQSEKIFENVDRDNKKQRKFNLNVRTIGTKKNADVRFYLSNAKKRYLFGTTTPCIKVKGKLSCSAKYAGKTYVDSYNITTYAYPHNYWYKNKNARAKEARNTITHEYGHALGMGHFYKKGSKQPFASSYKSLMGYDSNKNSLTAYDIRRLQNIYGK